jgi:hypothetical protein
MQNVDVPAVERGAKKKRSPQRAGAAATVCILRSDFKN